MSDSDSNPSREQFAQLVLDRLKQTQRRADFVYDAQRFELRLGEAVSFLGGVFDDYCAKQGADRERVLNNFVSAFSQSADNTLPSFDEAESNLVAVVRERMLFEETKIIQFRDGKPPPKSLFYEPLTDWFVRALVIDAPGHMTIVAETHLERWRQPTSELFAAGLTRLRESAPPKFTEKNGVFCSAWNDDYDASRVLLPELFASLGFRGAPVLALPHRLTLLAADSDDPDAVKRLLATAEQICGKEARAMNPAPLIWSNGRLKDYSVPPSSPVYREIERARKIAALVYYEGQRQLLERIYKEQNKDVHVSALKLYDEGRYVTRAFWGHGVKSLLPVADEIALMDLRRPEGQRLVALLPWDKLIQLAGDKMLDAGLFPKRYFVEEFPNV